MTDSRHWAGAWLMMFSLGCGAGVPAPEAAFGSEVAAVVAAGTGVLGRSRAEDREFLGAVLRRGGDYHYTVVPGVAGADRIRARLVIPAGFELVAFWHTHGAPAPERGYFSGVDVALVAGTGRPLYLVDPAGTVRVLKPGAPRLSARAAGRLGLPGRPGFAAGEVLSGPDGEPLCVPVDVPALPALVRN